VVEWKSERTTAVDEVEEEEEEEEELVDAVD